MKYPKITAALMSGALALSIGLVGCGGGSQSTAASEGSAAESTATETSATSDTSSATEANYEWSSCYMGAGESGEIFYYAEDKSDSSNLQGLMIVLDPETGKYISFVGPATNPSDTQVTITDTSSGNAITFEVVAAEDDKLLVDLGDTGKAVLAECTSADINEAIDIIDAHGQAVA
ncbi:MAG: hypothetical protein Q4B54_06105 [Coriobacteriales bacterium]|nr:hypothetical protein [Coriobacteriales bacterium]